MIKNTQIQRSGRVLRFSQLYELNTKIRNFYEKNFPLLLEKLPQFPPQKIAFLTDHTLPAFIENRRADLDAYFEALVCVLGLSRVIRTIRAIRAIRDVLRNFGLYYGFHIYIYIYIFILMLMMYVNMLCRYIEIVIITLITLITLYMYIGYCRAYEYEP